ncbi:MAG: hypothetical protein ACHQ7N_14795 [Candidatus Methylomirabilales bacterium]
MERSTGARVMPPAFAKIVAGANEPNGSPEAHRGRRHPRQIVNVPAYAQTLPEK